MRELPPRARRIHLTAGLREAFRGTTSACAENTNSLRTAPGLGRNYLRVRGEYTGLRSTPPATPGTTSACAENTSENRRPRGGFRNYLRVRGEYVLSPTPVACWWELPPRARRIRRALSMACSRIGTTSACAENTAGAAAGPPAGWNYLRVRGEYRGRHLRPLEQPELPPRARRIP